MPSSSYLAPKIVSTPLGRSAETSVWRVVLALAALALVSCGRGEPSGPSDLIEVGSIVIDTTSFNIERGTTAAIRATVKDAAGAVIDVPLVWRSSNDSLATFDASGKLIARDTGVVNLIATSLGVVSAPVSAHIVWDGPASIQILPADQGLAVSPSARLRDSIRVVVRNRTGALLAGVHVQFTVTAGSGSISPASIVTSSNNGTAATAFTLGPAVGLNTISVSVVTDAGDPLTRVQNNPSTYGITSYLPISTISGDLQTGQILSDLPVVPTVKLVDDTGAPRIGVPVTFTATQGGRVEVVTASTDANGNATPGIWTLGDLSGPQQLIVSVESAAVTLSASATGTPIYYTPSQIIAGAMATCGIATGHLASCFGQSPQNGSGDTASLSKPTATAGNIAFKSIDGMLSHFCGVGDDKSAYCWGTFAYADTAGTIHATQPTRLGSAIDWIAAAAGGGHNCAIATDQTAYCWGEDLHGQLGDRGSATRFKPVQVSGGFTFASITAGGTHSCGLTLDGTGLCWGGNQFGQLGDGSISDRNTPTLVSGGVKYQSIRAGDSFTCGLSLAGIASCWGALVNGPVTTPQAVAGVPKFAALTVGGGHACALAEDGTAYCWGANGFGQLGDSTTTSRPTAAAVVTSLKFVAISAGLFHTCGITTSGSVACWGRNGAGELGDRIVTFRTTPRLVVLGVNP